MKLSDSDIIPTTFDNYSLHKSCNMTLLICKLTMYSKVVSLVGSVLFHCSLQIWFISGLNINTPVSHSKTLGIYISRVFWTNQYTNQIYKGATMVGDELGNFPNLCLQILTPDMHSLALSVLIFFCKTFFKLFKTSLWKTIFHGFFKNSYTQIKNLYGFKLVRAAKQYGLKRCSRQHRRNKKSEIKKWILALSIT